MKIPFAKEHPDRFFAAILFGLAVLLYANTLGHDYAWDDSLVITGNSRVQKGFAGIGEHFSDRARVKDEDFLGYRPVTLTTFSIEVGLFGQVPFWPHLTNMLLYALLCVILYYVLRQLFPHHNRLFAFLIALIYLVHPLHVEVVANIKSRDELLAFFFGLLMLYFFIRHYREQKWHFMGLSLVFFILSALSKESGMVTVMLMPLAVVFLLEGSLQKKLFALANAAGFFVAFVLLYKGMTGRVPWQFSPVAPEGVLEASTLGNSFSANNSFWERITNGIRLGWNYTGDFAFPHPLTYYSGYNQLPFHDWTSGNLWMYWYPNMAVMLYFIVQTVRRKRRILSFGFAFFWVFIALYLQIVAQTADTRADRYMFMASLGLCVMLVQALYLLFGFAERGKGRPVFEKGKLLIKDGKAQVMLGLVAVLAVAFSVKTVSRNMAWKNNMALFSTDIPHLENCSRAHYFLATELSRQLDENPNQPEVKRQVFKHFSKAVAITDSAYYAWIDWGRNHMRYNEFAQAEQVFAACAKVHRRYPDPWFYLGKAQYFQEKYAAAAENLERSRKLDPRPDETWELLGRALERSEQYDRAEAIIVEAIGRNPQNLRFKDALVDTYFDNQRYEDAFSHMIEIVNLEPENPVWWKKIIGLYQQVGNAEAAAYYYQMGVQRGVLEAQGGG